MIKRQMFMKNDSKRTFAKKKLKQTDLRFSLCLRDSLKSVLFITSIMRWSKVSFNFLNKIGKISVMNGVYSLRGLSFQTGVAKNVMSDARYSSIISSI